MKNVAVIGPMRSGKDTVGEYLVTRHKYVRLAFADAIKQEVADTVSNADNRLWTVDDINDQKTRFRPLLQWWGTEFRRHDNPNYWVNKLEERIFPLSSHFRLVVTDARFVNELQMLKRRDFVVIRLDPDYEMQKAFGVKGSVMEDDSENEWKEWPPDYTFENKHSAFEVLAKQIQSVLE